MTINKSYRTRVIIQMNQRHKLVQRKDEEVEQLNEEVNEGASGNKVFRYDLAISTQN